MITKLDWVVVVQDVHYDIFCAADMLPVCEGPLKISRMYCLTRNKCNYVLAILTNGTFRLYSKAKHKLYFAGRLTSLRWLPNNV